MASVADKLITAEEFLRMPDPPDGSKLELVRGVVVVMSPPPEFEHGETQVNVATLLRNYAKATKSGRVTVESGVVTERDPDSVCGPDVSFWSAARLPLDAKVHGYPEAVPDLCVEILTPHSNIKKIEDKTAEYFTAGVRMVWIVNPKERTVRVYRSPEEGRILHESAILAEDDVLPGFTCQVSEFFD